VRLRSAAAVEDEAEQEAVEEGMLIPGLRVLVAEDSTVNQMVILHELRRMGCTPEAVNNGREALRAVREGEYDLVLMDCQMPEMDGYEAAREIRRLPMTPPELPIIAITANAMVGERVRCMAAGMSGYLSKPFSRTQLRQVVVEALPESFMVGNEGAEPALGEDEVDALITESEDMGGELLRGLAEAFVVEATEALEVLTLAAKSQDGPRISAAAHKLRGSGSNFGARPLARICDRMERHARADALTEAIALIPELRQEAKRVIDSLNAILPLTAGAPVPVLNP
jgi:CheY-like chemotaxis protein/HPt (histidine-containing phosphotransfer) domain-containing protein